MADEGRFSALKAKLNNDFLFGDDKAPMMIVDVKRVLSDFSAPTVLKTGSVEAGEADGTGLTFVETSEWKRNVKCFGCGKKGHILNECPKTSAKRKDEIRAMVESSDFKKTNKGVVQVNTGKGGDKFVAPSNDNDVERFEDFVGVQEMNVGTFTDEPDFDDNPFGFFGINFGEFGKTSSLKAGPQGRSTETGVSLTNVNCCRNKIVIFEASSGGNK